jgi:hypothetical protein
MADLDYMSRKRFLKKSLVAVDGSSPSFGTTKSSTQLEPLLLAFYTQS